MTYLNGQERLRFSVGYSVIYAFCKIVAQCREIDTIETFFDSRMDLLERRLKKHSDRLKMRAEEAFKFKAPSGDLFVTKDLDKEVQKFKLKVNFTGCLRRKPEHNH